MDWKIILSNFLAGLATSAPIFLAFYMATRGGFAEAAEKAGKSLNELWDHVEEMDEKFKKQEKRYQVLFAYLLQNIEYMRKNNLALLEPPVELQTDPEIMVYFRNTKPLKKIKRSPHEN